MGDGTKLIYFITDYGSKVVIGGQVTSNALEALKSNGIQLASRRLLIFEEKPLVKVKESLLCRSEEIPELTD